MLESFILKHYIITDYLQRDLHTQWEQSEYLYQTMLSVLSLRYGMQCWVHSSQMPWNSKLKGAIACSTSVPDQTTVANSGLSFKGKIKHFVLFFLVWFSFLKWRYRGIYLFKTQLLTNFPNKNKWTNRIMPMWSSSLYIPQAHSHPLATDTGTKQTEGKVWSITEQNNTH